MKLSQLKPRICGIYKIYNTQTKKIYIGQSIDIEHRLYNHVDMLLNGKHSNKAMILDCQLFGLDSFDVEILEECNKKDLYKRETFWALKENKKILYNNTKNLKGYNKK